MDIKIGESDLINRAKELFCKSKFKECISYIEETDVNLSFEHHYILQIYRGLSLFEYCQVQEADSIFKRIFYERYEKRGKQIDEIDLVFRAQYQLLISYNCIQRAEELNEILLQETKEYEKQHKNTENFNQGVYLFGMGTYLYIESAREEVVSPLAYEYLEQAFLTCKKYELEILKVLGSAYLYCKCKDKTRANEWCKKLYDLNPDYPSAVGIYAVQLLEGDDVELTEKILLECLEKCDYDSVALNNLADFYKSQHKDEQEKECMEKMFALTPKTTQIYCKYGSYLMRSGQEEQGLELLKTAIQIDPKDFDSYQELIKYEIEHDQQQAIKYCKKCIEIFPNDGFSQYQLAAVYISIQQFINTEALLQRSIQFKNYAHLKPDSQYLLAQVYEAKGSIIKAFVSYLKYCGYKTVNNELFQESVSRVANICSHLRNLKRVIGTISDQEGTVVERYSDFALSEGLIPLVKPLFLMKLDELRNTLSILLYQKQIQSHLTYKSQTQFWDLFLE